ncbi:ParB/RepB/Spo0J family partition protein [Deinococcus peraridilitoris]|uniref:Putative transcriptional regulator n=1 Tax=Deinococcus peraridilitoris (strain DSM 19664 / LMG 22246 / CIP 109416 / KR-200) TaxID=937777 RepID=L0A7H4_DEIPD|nr:ParB N-terminal domain-containing protein [Deinococcus peraridilitoris]AFZ69766.1 putative transcriptional regulator [Deinococcus peraridilitoris DSM 19664]
MTAPAAQLTTLPQLRLTHPTETTPSDVTLVPWSSLRRSEYNPRKTFDDKTLFELATDIHHKGILQNLVVRPHPTEDGAFEIAAGERRYRAVGLLVDGLELVDENGGESTVLKVGADYLMPVKVQPLTDLQLLEIATTENLQRDQMSPLDEADAFARLYALDMQPDEIATRFGYSLRTVEQRLILAKGLGKDGRKLLSNGTISLAQAQVLSQTSGKLKQHLLNLVRDNPAHYTADQLRKLTTQGRLLVENAMFDVAASGLSVIEDLWGVTPSYFKDSEKALALQAAAIEELAESERASLDWAFVDVLPTEGYITSLPWQQYRHYGPDSMKGLVLCYHTHTGELKRHEGVIREAEAKAAERNAEAERRTKDRAESGPKETPIRDDAHYIGHVSRARALWGQLAQDHKRCLVLTIQAFFEHSHEITLRATHAPKIGDLLPEIDAMVKRWTVERPDLFKSYVPCSMIVEKRGNDLHDALMGLELDQLLELLAFHTHDQLHHWGNVRTRPGRLANHVAQAIEADKRLTCEWQVTAPYLNAHTTAQLSALIATMPEELRPSIAPGSTKKESVARILEKAAALQQAGWVPDLVQFKA